MILSCERMVEKFTSQLARECPELDYEDIKGDLWITALETLQKWRPGTDNGKFSSFLFQKLVWKRLDILDQQIRRGLINRRLCGESFPVVVRAVEKSFDTLCSQVCSHLGDSEQQLFMLMIKPYPSLMEMVSSSRTLPFRGPEPWNRYYATYFGWSRWQVDSVVRKIKEAVEEVISNG